MKKNHSAIAFFTVELVNLRHQKQYNLVICHEALQYTVSEPDRLINNLGQLTSPAGFVYVGLSFSNFQKQYIGKHIHPSIEALINKLEERFATVIDNRLLGKNSLKMSPVCIG